MYMIILFKIHVLKDALQYTVGKRQNTAAKISGLGIFIQIADLVSIANVGLHL